MSEKRIDDLLRKVSVSRRGAIKTLLAAGFAVPVVASFPMDGRFEIDKALAQATNGSSS
jgi:hypothetical protein